MLKSRIEFINGKPEVVINENVYYPIAYTTYFEECAQYGDFIDNGYRMFFVNVSFTDLPINNVSGFSPFLTGIFEKEEPDYTEFDNALRHILSLCPDALIFPRINIAMPRKWIEKNLQECVETPNGGMRESLCSEVFKRDATELLKKIIEHIHLSDYSESIAGYQICGGTTQEWMHHDLLGSYSEKSLEKFKVWLENKYGITDMEMPSREDLFRDDYSENISKYGEFCCEKMAETVNYFAKAVKELTSYSLVVGTFYGYSAFVNDPLTGLLGLRHIIDSPYIDFFSSPCAYDNNRGLGIDWSDMLAGESLRIRNKLYFVECDIRTCFTKRMQSSREGRYPDNILPIFDDNGNKTVWNGPDTIELSCSALRKAFMHQLTKGFGIWWFDMWGGWYHNEEIMSELNKLRLVTSEILQKNKKDTPQAETVFFIDEKAYFNTPRGGIFRHGVNITRMEMSNVGTPYDICLTEDAPRVIKKYKAAIFSAPIPTESTKEAVSLCESLHIPYIKASEEKPFYKKDEIKSFLASSGVHLYNDDDCVIYCGNGYLGVHSIKNGEVKIRLPEKYTLVPVFKENIIGETENTDEITLNMKEHHTAIFELL